LPPLPGDAARRDHGAAMDAQITRPCPGLAAWTRPRPITVSYAAVAATTGHPQRGRLRWRLGM